MFENISAQTGFSILFGKPAEAVVFDKVSMKFGYKQTVQKTELRFCCQNGKFSMSDIFFDMVEM